MNQDKDHDDDDVLLPADDDAPGRGLLRLAGDRGGAGAGGGGASQHRGEVDIRSRRDFSRFALPPREPPALALPPR